MLTNVDDLEAAARATEVQPMSSVSAKTIVLVCADPDSQSGKARKADHSGCG